MSNSATTLSDLPKCFVVMGYATRTDPDSSKAYDLDKSYRSVIFDGVKAAGFHPIRSDEIAKPGMISRQMYQSLMDAPLVVCDLTTLNPNALFELGVRMALRPRATVVIAAEGTKIPFNLNQERFFFYRHGGAVIDYEDARTAQDKLATICREAVKGNDPDSLIYSIFHAELEPPRWKEAAPNDSDTRGEDGPADSFAAERAFVDEAKKKKRWADAIERLGALHREADREKKPIERWLTQQWALVTYKQRETPTSVDVNDLRAARNILTRLNPASATDAETLGLWAAIHKRLSEQAEREAALRKQDLGIAIDSYRKGYVLRADHYTGINYAFLLVRRAVELPDANELRNVRDLVEASDTWSHLVLLCQDARTSPIPDIDPGVPLKREERERLDERFWCTASLAQALRGLKDPAYKECRQRLEALQALFPEDTWMMETSDKQEQALATLMQNPRFERLSTYAPAGSGTGAP